ncbi:MAG: hypothetical protein RIR32_399 [Verrucomicrobiota bacterium]|jgi:hypothetical protein
MPPEPTTDRAVRSGFLLGLGCVVALVVGALAFFGRPHPSAARPSEATRATDAKTIRTKAGHAVRSSAKIRLDEAGNILPDAPELGPRFLEDWEEAKRDEFLTWLKESGFADESRLLGVSKAAENVLEAMIKEPRWARFEQELETLKQSWPAANQEERRLIRERYEGLTVELIDEARRRFSALR